MVTKDVEGGKVSDRLACRSSRTMCSILFIAALKNINEFEIKMVCFQPNYRSVFQVEPCHPWQLPVHGLVICLSVNMELPGMSLKSPSMG